MDAAMKEDNGFTARSLVEKARARRLIASGKAEIADRMLETRIINGRLFTYEAWDVQLIGERA